MEFDFEKAIQQATQRLDQDERAAVLEAARKVAASLETTENRLRQSIAREAESGVADVNRAAAEARMAMIEMGKEETRHVHARVSTLGEQLGRLESSASVLLRTLHPVWGQLPRNLYLGLAVTLGVVGGVAMVIALGAVKWHGMSNDLAGLEARRDLLASNIAAFEHQAGFRLVWDGNRVVMALDEGFEVKRYVSVRGPFSRALANAWQVVRD